MHVYVLKLEHDCWYVGTTTDRDRRFDEHVQGDGSAWTALHPPLVPMQKESWLITDGKVPGLVEDAKVLELMHLHGIHLVRGGSFSAVELDDEDCQTLTKMEWHANGKCIRCGGDDHWAKDCQADDDDEDDEDNFCARCGSDGHLKPDCRAKRDVHGRRL